MLYDIFLILILWKIFYIKTLNYIIAHSSNLFPSCTSFMVTILSHNNVHLFIYLVKSCVRSRIAYISIKLTPSMVMQNHLLDLSDCTWFPYYNQCERNRCLPMAALLTLDIGGARMVQIQSKASPDFTLFSSSTWLDLIIPSDPDISNWQSEGKRQQ